MKEKNLENLMHDTCIPIILVSSIQHHGEQDLEKRSRTSLRTKRQTVRRELQVNRFTAAYQKSLNL